MLAPLCVRRRRHKKTPHPFPGAGFFGNLQVCCLVTWITPSARTSVGNKEYEYKGKKERAAKLQQAVDRQETMRFGGAAGVAALRHVIDRKRSVCSLSTVYFETFLIQAANFIRTSIHPRLESTSRLRAGRRANPQGLWFHDGKEARK
jgi:hypothetical protein